MELCSETSVVNFETVVMLQLNEPHHWLIKLSINIISTSSKQEITSLHKNCVCKPEHVHLRNRLCVLVNLKYNYKSKHVHF